MNPRHSLGLVFATSLVILAANPCANAKERPPTYFTSPCKCVGAHSDDRKVAKLDPARQPAQASSFRTITPSGMYALAPVPGLTGKSPRAPVEQQWYKVTGKVVEVKAEADGDIHFELADATGRKRGRILAEVPLGTRWCALRKVVFGWTKKGQAFARFRASSRPLPLNSHPVVTVLGKGFFDTHHAKKRPLLNRSNIDDTGMLAAWEIHPVAGITAPQQ
ncbi:MAG TPA: hypothetical protein VJU77_18930 [Chthoniobacterales bacterium]|nr:hypothetical protein [Chthoniobacterales bacterium]